MPQAFCGISKDSRPLYVVPPLRRPRPLYVVPKSEIEKARQARKKEAEAKTKALEQENAALKERVKALEQENTGLKAIGDKTTAQLGKDITDARNELTRSEQARKADEAKIKALEQENADLKKKSKPLDFLKKK
jgi:hypothetical protein